MTQPQDPQPGQFPPAQYPQQASQPQFQQGQPQFQQGQPQFQQGQPQYAPPGYQQVMPPTKKHRKWPWVLLGLLVVVIVIVVTTSGGSKTPTATTTSGVTASAPASAGAASAPAVPAPAPAPTGAAADVTISGCETDPTLGAPVAHVTILNHSSKPSNYLITISFDSADGKTQIDTGNAVVSNLAPGQSANQDANSLKSGVAPGFVCKVADVTRYAS